jgi:hypothetical protein
MRTSSATLGLLAFLTSAPLAACLDDGAGDKGEEEALPTEGGADSFRYPIEHGEIAWGVPQASALTTTERYHAWNFELSGDATVDMTTSYALLGQRRTDTVLYLYKEGATGWGSYIARNDDYADTLYSQLVRALGAGRYRVLVKGYAATTKGKFKLSVNCTGAGCEPAAPPAATCLFGDTYGEIAGNAALVTNNANEITIANLSWLSAADQQRLVLAVQQSSHTDVTTPEEALGRVDQGEVNVTWLSEPAARRSYIAFEYGAGDNSYGAIFDQTSGAMVTSIHDGDLLDCTVVAETCLLPEDYSALRADPATFVLWEDRAITSATQLEGVEVDQVLGALRRVYGEVATVDAGIAMADESVVHLRAYQHAPTSTDLTLVEWGAGDTSVGTIYYYRSVQVAGVISDLFIGGCSLFAAHGDGAAAAGEACRAESDCDGTLRCIGVFAGAGVCVTIDDLDGEGAECATDAACGDAGLICAGATRGFGLCNPAWMRGSFVDAASSAIPDGATLARPIAVRGLATVDTDVVLRATFDHPRASQLRITLTNPAGNEVLIHDGAAADDGQPLVIDRPIVNGFSGDEQVNGEWTLRVEDRAIGQTGVLAGWELTVTSRWD